MPDAPNPHRLIELHGIEKVYQTGRLEYPALRGVDVSVELSGSAVATRQCFQILRKGGRVSLVGLGGDVTLNPTADIIYREAQVYGVTGRVMWETWYQIMDIIASGRFDPIEIITHRFPLGEYAQALELAKSGEAGKILLLP